MKMPLCWLLLAGALLPCATASRAAPPASTASLGQILELSGSVRVARGNQPAGKVMSLYQLQSGDVISVGLKGAARIILYRTGACFRVQPGAVVVAQEQSLKPRTGPPPVPDGTLPVRLTHRANGPSSGVFAGLLARDPGGTLGPGKLEPQGSVRGQVVARWKTHFSPAESAGADAHIEVQILDAKSQVVGSATLPITAQEWRPSDGALRPGELYHLSVEAVTPALGRRSASSYFRRLPSLEEDLVREAEAGAREALGANPQDLDIRLLLARVYTEFDLVLEARREYEAVLAARPDDAGIAEALAALDARDKRREVPRGAK